MRSGLVVGSAHPTPYNAGFVVGSAHPTPYNAGLVVGSAHPTPVEVGDSDTKKKKSTNYLLIVE